MLGLLVLCAAASAIIAFSMSALLGALLTVLRGRFAELTAAAEARVLFGVALFPMLFSLAMMTAALAPSFGWLVDHCGELATAHTHPHICAAHDAAALPAASLIVLGGLLFARVAASAAQLIRGALTARSTRRALLAISQPCHESGGYVLPLDEPQAFVVGVIKPVLFVTRGLVSAAHREHLPPVLAHEREHLRRRDPLRRVVSSVALAFHLPGIAGWLEARLATAHEMAADAHAAREVASPERVARALVGLTRAYRRVPSFALAFGASNIEVRVATLLDRRPRRDQPRTAVLVGGVALLFAIVALGADAVHHGVEIALGLLGG